VKVNQSQISASIWVLEGYVCVALLTIDHLLLRLWFH